MNTGDKTMGEQRKMCSGRGWGRHGIAAVVMTLGLGAWADQPFLRLETATVEHDDERNYEISTLFSRNKESVSRQIQIEYNHSPFLSFEVELGTERSRIEPEREREIELGVRYVLVDHNRNDWGLALKGSVEWEGGRDEDGKVPTRRTGHTLLGAFVLPLADNRVRLHANLGWQHDRESRDNIRRTGLGMEAHLTPTVVAFAEHGRRRSVDELSHAGLRWWVKKEKFAVQLSSSRTRDLQGGEALKGVHIGLSFSDLSF
jgi:hypothetical protein